MTDRIDQATLPPAILYPLTGYVDALAFCGIASILGTGWPERKVELSAAVSVIVPVVTLLGTFVVGVVIASLMGRSARSLRLSAVLVLVASGLVLAAVADPASGVTLFALAFTAGAQQVVYERQAAVANATEAPVRFGAGFAGAGTGEPPRTPPVMSMRSLILWVWFAVGFGVGVFVYMFFGQGSLWGGAVAASALAVVGRQLKTS